MGLVCPEDLVAGCHRLTFMVEDPQYPCLLFLVHAVLVALSHDLLHCVHHLFLQSEQPDLYAVPHVYHIAELYDLSFRAHHAVD